MENGLLWMDAANRDCSRQLNLPDKMRLNIEAIWSPGRAVLSTRFYTDATVERGQPLTHFGVNFTEGNTSFSASVPSFTNAQLNTTVRCPQLLTNLNQRCQATFTILAQRSTGQVRDYLDGHPAGEWRAPAGMTPTGNSITISAHANAGLALRNVTVSEWRDWPTMPSTAVPPLPDATRGPTEALVVLQNGDRVTLEGVGWDGNALTGRHKVLGAVTLSAAAVRSLEWPVPPRTPVRR